MRRPAALSATVALTTGLFVGLLAAPASAGSLLPDDSPLCNLLTPEACAAVDELVATIEAVTAPATDQVTGGSTGVAPQPTPAPAPAPQAAPEAPPATARSSSAAAGSDFGDGEQSRSLDSGRDGASASSSASVPKVPVGGPLSLAPLGLPDFDLSAPSGVDHSADDAAAPSVVEGIQLASDGSGGPSATQSAAARALATFCVLLMGGALFVLRRDLVEVTTS